LPSPERFALVEEPVETQDVSHPPLSLASMQYSYLDAPSMALQESAGLVEAYDTFAGASLWKTTDVEVGVCVDVIVGVEVAVWVGVDVRVSVGVLVRVGVGEIQPSGRPLINEQLVPDSVLSAYCPMDLSLAYGE
jgi:hypothetical protein